MMFLDCPAYLDQDGAVRCGLPAEVTCRFTMRSTDGPIESARIRCPAGHYFCGAIESLTWDRSGKRHPDRAAATSRAGRGGDQDSHDLRHDDDGSALRDYPTEPSRKVRRPNTAPAYYLGRPAAVWITATRPRGRTTASRDLMEAAISGSYPTGTPGVLQHSRHRNISEEVALWVSGLPGCSTSRSLYPIWAAARAGMPRSWIWCRSADSLSMVQCAGPRCAAPKPGLFSR